MIDQGDFLACTWRSRALHSEFQNLQVENTATCKRTTEGFVAHLCSPTTKQWLRREEESRSISDPQKPLFSWLGTPHDLDTAYGNWLQNLYCGSKLLKSFMPILVWKRNCQRSELLSWESKLRTSLWAAAGPAVTSQALSSLCNYLTWAGPRIQIHSTTLSKQITKYQAAPQRRQNPGS